MDDLFQLLRRPPLARLIAPVRRVARRVRWFLDAPGRERHEQTSQALATLSQRLDALSHGQTAMSRELDAIRESGRIAADISIEATSYLGREVGLLREAIQDSDEPPADP